MGNITFTARRTLLIQWKFVYVSFMLMASVANVEVSVTVVDFY